MSTALGVKVAVVWRDTAPFTLRAPAAGSRALFLKDRASAMPTVVLIFSQLQASLPGPEGSGLCCRAAVLGTAIIIYSI